MRYTLLDLVQTILSSMDSDEVNSIGDTTEADQVARVVRTCFYDIVGRANLPEQYGLFELNATTSATPTVMQRPSDVDSIEWLKYNKVKAGESDIDFKDVCFLELGDFLDRMYQLKSSDTDITAYTYTINGNSIDILAKKDKAPEFYTSWNDNTILFDSYDEAQDEFLQKTKTLAFGRKSFAFPLTDSFVPPLDDDQFALLLNESKSLAFAELKQSQNAKAEQYARRGWIRQQKNKRAIGEIDRLPNYGRK